MKRLLLLISIVCGISLLPHTLPAAVAMPADDPPNGYYFALLYPEDLVAAGLSPADAQTFSGAWAINLHSDLSSESVIFHGSSIILDNQQQVDTQYGVGEIEMFPFLGGQVDCSMAFATDGGGYYIPSWDGATLKLNNSTDGPDLCTGERIALETASFTLTAP